jgi:Tfp pilus assembly protein PilZ
MKIAARSGASLALAAATLFVAGSVVAVSDAQASKKVACVGVNACKGKGACKTAENACKGKNACKGHGVSMMSKSKCTKKGGHVES